MQRKTLFRHLAVATAVLTLAGAAHAQAVLKFSHTDQPGGARQKAAELFGKKVEEYTQGRYKVQVYPAGQLANDPKAVEQLQLGGIDFTVTGTGTYATHIPTLNLTALPFLVESYEQGWKLYDESSWMKAQFAKGPDKGFRFLSPFEAGFRSMTTKEPLVTPADAKGKKLRSFPNEMMRWQLDAMGFSVQILPLPEVYLAIQQGAVRRTGKPDRHDPCEQVLRGRALRHADPACLQPDPDDDFGKDPGKSFRRKTAARSARRPKRPPTGAARKSAATTIDCSPT